jgi:WD40 repeat protein
MTAGGTLGIASQNGSIYFYKAERGGWMFRKSGLVNGNIPLARFDWSINGNFVRAQSQDHDVFFWNVQSNPATEETYEKMKDEVWATHTCTVAYDCAGLWKNGNYAEDTTISACGVSNSGKLLIAGDADGAVRLFRYKEIIIIISETPPNYSECNYDFHATVYLSQESCC